MPYMFRETGFAFSWPKLKEMIAFGLPLIPSSFMSYIVNVSDRFFVNAFQGLQVTGLYTLGYRFGVLVNEFVASPFAQIWQPRRFELFKKGDSEEIFARIFTYFSLAMFFGGLGISVTIKDVIQFISEPSYWTAWKVVPPLTLSYIIASFQMHFNIGILMKKKTKYVMYINVSTAILNLILNYFLIKQWGMWGAVWATIVSFVVKIALVYIVSNRLVPIVVEWGRLAKIATLAFVLYWPINMIETGFPIVNILIKSLACLTYPFLLYVIRFYEPGEVRQGWDLARPYVAKVLPMFRENNGPKPPAA
jgi:O-antigen/teichoic acid export membrane protein